MAAAPMVLQTIGVASNEQGFSNCVFVNPANFEELVKAAGADPHTAAERGVLCSINNSCVYFVKPYAAQAANTIAVALFQRLAGSLAMNVGVPVAPFRPSPGYRFPLSNVTLEVNVLKDGPEETLDAAEFTDFLHRRFHSHVFKVGQTIPALYNDRLGLKLTVKALEYLDVAATSSDSAAASGAGAATAAGGATGGAGTAGGAANDSNIGGARIGQFLRTTTVDLRRADGAANLKIKGSGSGKAPKLLDKGFNFQALGIGGLNKEFADIFRRAFASRVVPPDVLKKMGQKHVRGMLLYGPPGCGKTLIARQIGKALHAAPPKIVNGPEIMNKYVGESEANIRKLFEDAEKEQAERGDDSDLHIIIFDEFDAICRQRGTTGGGTGVNDSIVNQLLSKIDGVESLNNILIIGMTNRKDMIDEAVLRPGRLEVHIEIGLPDEEGRIQILNIHTGEMKKHKLLADDVSIPDIASRTKNYTGAEIEGLVKTACSYVFERQVDPSDISKMKDFKSVLVTRADFDRALDETTPMFGVKEDELTRLYANGVISTGPEFDRVYGTVKKLLHQVAASDRTPLVSVILTGPAGSGRTALAAKLGVESGFPFVKRISGESLVSHSETGKADAITRCFNDAYKSPASLIILDDLERLIEYVAVGPRFSNAILQTLLVLVKSLPPPGHKLFIIGTTALPDLLEHMELLSTFQLALSVPTLTEEESFRAVFKATGALSDADADAAAKHLKGKSVCIKKLLTIIEMALQSADMDSSASAAASGAATAAAAGAASPAAGGSRGQITFEQLLHTAMDWGL